MSPKKNRSRIAASILCLVLCVITAGVIPVLALEDGNAATAPLPASLQDPASTQESESPETEPPGTVTDETTSEETVTDETASEETVTDETTPEETVTDETTSEETVTDETTPEETVTDETTPEETVTDETTPEETLPDETTPEEVDAAAEEESDETALVCGVPRYFQGDYPHDLYANGTVASDGCSVTALTMVANAVTGHNYTVDELAEYFGGLCQNNIQRLEHGSRALGLPFHRSENWDYTMAALREGKIVIALMEGSSLFTDTQHFIVLAGLTEDEERILVNDPNRNNYDLWNLKNAFQSGFLPEDILLGYGGAWIYERNPEEIPARYRATRIPHLYGEGREDPQIGELLAVCNYPGISVSWEERELLARLIWAEARGEIPAGQQAVAEVVFNRLTSGQYGQTISNIIYGEGQFRSVEQNLLEDAEPTQAQYQAIDRALFDTPVLRRDIVYFANFPVTPNVYITIGNHVFCAQ